MVGVGLAASGVAAVLLMLAVYVSQAAAAQPRCAGLRATIVGTVGNDYIRGTAGRDVIVALDGADTIWARAGNDEVCAGRGDDHVRGGPGRDNARGGTGADAIFGEAGRDALFGGGDDDRVFGGTQSDLVYGSWGDDLLHGGDGVDFLFGAVGQDHLFGDAGDDELLDEDGTLDGGAGVDQCETVDVPLNCEPLIVGGTFAPGTYKPAKFIPAFGFTVHDRGWQTYSPQSFVFELAWYTGRVLTTQGSLIFQRYPLQVLDPGSGRLSAAPADLLGWLSDHPCLVAVGSAFSSSVGGITGVSAEFTRTACPRFGYLWPYGECQSANTCFDALSVVEGDLFRVTIFSAGSTLLVISQIFDVETWPTTHDAFRSDAARLLDSINF